MLLSTALLQFFQGHKFFSSLSVLLAFQSFLDPRALKLKENTTVTLYIFNLMKFPILKLRETMLLAEWYGHQESLQREDGIWGSYTSNLRLHSKSAV